MKDNFKDYVDKNRDDFDCYEDDFGAIWDNISEGLNKRKQFRPNRFKFLKVAASIILLFSVALIYQQSQKSDYVSEELAEVEYHYSPQLAQKMTLVKAYKLEVDEMIWKDLEELDKFYDILKEDLKDQADNEEVVDAIIENYRIRLNILDQILKEIELKKNEDKKNSGTDI